MQNLLFLISFLMLNLLASAQTLSPQLLSPGGDHFESGDISLSWSIGELSVATYEEGSLVLNQGFHHNFGVVTNVDEIKHETLSLYPNPVQNLLTISFGDKAKTGMLQVFDLTGNLVINQKFNNARKITTDFSSLPSSMYMILLLDEKQEVIESTKIIKK